MKSKKSTESFSIDDIHNIRVAHYEKTKNLTKEERINWYNKRGDEIFRNLQKLPKKN